MTTGLVLRCLTLTYPLGCTSGAFVGVGMDVVPSVLYCVLCMPWISGGGVQIVGRTGRFLFVLWVIDTFGDGLEKKSIACHRHPVHRVLCVPQS